MIERLSPRELQVLALIAAGATSKQIAVQLHLARSTVKIHWSNALAKLQADNAPHAVAIAFRRGLLQ